MKNLQLEKEIVIRTCQSKKPGAPSRRRIIVINKVNISVSVYADYVNVSIVALDVYSNVGKIMRNDPNSCVSVAGKVLMYNWDTYSVGIYDEVKQEVIINEQKQENKMEQKIEKFQEEQVACEMITSLELVKQINLFREQECNRKELSHSDLLKIIRNEFEEEINAGNFSSVTYKDKKGESRTMFELTLPQAKQVLVRESKFVRKATIAYIDKLENKLKEIATPQLPQNYLDALKCLVKSEEEKLLLQAENVELQSENTEMKPKAEFYSKVMESTDTISMSEVAKVLDMGIGRNNLFQLLREQKVLMTNGEPYQSYVDKGWFRLILSHYNDKNGNPHVNTKVLVYPKGLDGIRRILKKMRYTGKKD